MSNLETTLTLLKEKLQEFDSDPPIQYFHDSTFRAWAFSVDAIIIRGTGSARIMSKWRQAIKGLPYPNSIAILGYQENTFKAMFESRIPEVRSTLAAIIEEIEQFGLPEGDDTIVVTPKQRSNVFIAHGGETEALNKLADFLSDDLGVKPLIVERLPSEGRSVNENVEFYLALANAAIVLATCDDLVDGKYQPRANVHIELGRFQERFGDKVIYLLEEGAAYPSNVSEKVWERFTQDNMEKAFRKVVRELRSFGLLGVAVDSL
ncbi:MAG TPA: TIR domain-containing protein [Dehalococcoidia bacterium]|nr:TIR domain-containing protein [Dehalococcoidia bacterium]